MISRSPAETAAIGRWLGERLWPGAFLALTGDLGAGKTVLAAGVLSGLGVERSGGSPTFPLLWEYRGGRLPVYHWDVYRVQSPAELEDLGYEDSFYGDGVCLVEWANRVESLWPRERMVIDLAPAASGVRAEPAEPAEPAGPAAAGPQAWRRLRFQAAGTPYEHLLEALQHAGLGA